MKKFLLVLLATFMVAVSYAADTVFLVPGKPGNYELKVDTVKYPYLKDVDVNWYCGFGDLEVNFQQQGVHTVCAQKVPKEAITTLDDGTKLLHIEKVPEVWNPWQNIRTIELFYTHKIETKTIISDQYGDFYSQDEFVDFTCDTVATLHILKDLATVVNPTDLVSSFQVNDLNDGVIKLTKGDTAKFTISPVEALDIQKYMLVADEDTIAESDTCYIELIPEATIENINLVVYNKTGFYTFPWPKTLEVYPTFDVTNVIYSISKDGKTVITENPDSKDVELSVMNHDSISLKIETNISETLNPTRVTYNWNKDGKTLPKGIEVNKNILVIPEYLKPDMDGVYNCLVTAKDTTISTSFTITSEYPTANDKININEVTVIGSKGFIQINNIDQGAVKIVDAVGRIVMNKNVTSGSINVNVHSGIYFVVVNNKTYKVIVR